jgi:hypothetical protein
MDPTMWVLVILLVLAVMWAVLESYHNTALRDINRREQDLSRRQAVQLDQMQQGDGSNLLDGCLTTVLLVVGSGVLILVIEALGKPA